MDHVRQAVQGLRAEDDIDVGRAFDDRFTFLRGDTAGDPDDEIRIFPAQCFVETWPRSEKTFSCAFSRTEQVFNRMRSASSALSVRI